MTTLEILMKARAEVEKGWGRTAVDGAGNVCALGAIDVALGGSRDEPKVAAKLYTERWDVVDALGGSATGIVHFNDDRSTTKADVLQLFDRAIAAEAVKASPDPSHTFTVA
jgi:hypothetical protein